MGMLGFLRRPKICADSLAFSGAICSGIFKGGKSLQPFSTFLVGVGAASLLKQTLRAQNENRLMWVAFSLAETAKAPRCTVGQRRDECAADFGFRLE